MSARKAIDQITSDKVRTLDSWWNVRSGPGRVPDRREFNPADYARLLPNILISEVTTDPFRIRYRLVGTKVAAVLNIDFTGRYLDELVDGATETPWLDYYAESYRSSVPVMGLVTEPTTTGGTFTYEFGIFPVTTGGSEIRQFLSIEDYFDFNLTSAELMPWSLRDDPLLRPTSKQ